MFAIIDTKGANKIAIHIPLQGSEKSLPALAAMLEQNAVFINSGYYENKEVVPEMSISLGNELLLPSNDSDIKIVVPESSSVISEDFTLASPEVYTSNKEALDKAKKESDRLRTELACTKQQLELMKEKLSDIAGDECE